MVAVAGLRAADRGEARSLELGAQGLEVEDVARVVPECTDRDSQYVDRVLDDEAELSIVLGCRSVEGLRASEVHLGVSTYVGGDQADDTTRRQTPVRLLEECPCRLKRKVLDDVVGIDVRNRTVLKRPAFRRVEEVASDRVNICDHPARALHEATDLKFERSTSLGERMPRTNLGQWSVASKYDRADGLSDLGVHAAGAYTEALPAGTT